MRVQTLMLDNAIEKAITAVENSEEKEFFEDIALLLLERKRFGEAAHLLGLIPENRGSTLVSLLNVASNDTEAAIAIDLLGKRPAALEHILTRPGQLAEELTSQLSANTIQAARLLLVAARAINDRTYDRLCSAMIVRLVQLNRGDEARGLVHTMAQQWFLLRHWSELPKHLQAAVAIKIKDSRSAFSEEQQLFLDLHRNETGATARLMNSVQAGRIRPDMVADIVPLLNPSDRKRFVRAMLRGNLTSSSSAFELLPLILYLDFWSIKLLFAHAKRLHDDYRRDELVVALLPRLGQLVRAETLLAEAEARVLRSDWRPKAYAATLPFLAGATRSQVLHRLLQSPDQRAAVEALRQAAPVLDVAELKLVLPWIVEQQPSAICDMRIYADRVCELPRLDKIEVWHEILPRLEPLPRRLLFSTLGALAPLIAAIDSDESTIAVAEAVTQSFAWWP